MKLFIAVLSILFCVSLSRAQNYECVKLKANEGTRQGYFATYVFKEKKAYQFVRGTALLAEGTKEPLENVFVEVFAIDRKTKAMKRVVGCRTSKNGRFSFANISKGKYILRLSKDGGFSITEIHITVSPKSRRINDIKGFIELGK